MIALVTDEYQILAVTPLLIICGIAALRRAKSRRRGVKQSQPGVAWADTSLGYGLLLAGLTGAAAALLGEQPILQPILLIVALLSLLAVLVGWIPTVFLGVEKAILDKGAELDAHANKQLSLRNSDAPRDHSRVEEKL